MSTSHIDRIKAIYDERSGKYENSLHIHQARDYIQLAQLKDGEAVLDLACGTGLVTLPAKRKVGHRGYVVGVDISDGMLELARRKTQREGLDIEFVKHDISNLEGLNLLPEGSPGFNVIICAAALVLVENPLQAIKHWKSLLAPGGRLITDVPVMRASVPSHILAQIGPELGESLMWDQSWVKSEESLASLLTEAGLVVELVFMTEPYEIREYNRNNGSKLFLNAIESPMFKNFGQDMIRENAEALFVKTFREMAGSAGVVREEVRLYFGIARKEI